MKSILVATDGSPSATEAVAFGVEPAVENEAQLTLSTLVPMVDVVAAGFGAIGGAFPHEPSEHDRTLLDDRRRRSPASTGQPPRPRCLGGDTVEEIVAYADSRDVRPDRDRLSRSRSAYERLLGSVSPSPA